MKSLYCQYCRKKLTEIDHYEGVCNICSDKLANWENERQKNKVIQEVR